MNPFLKHFFLGTLCLSPTIFYAETRPAVKTEQTIEQIQAKLQSLSSEKESQLRAQYLYDLGMIYYRSGKWVPAAESFEKALLCEPKKSLKRNLYLYLGKTYEAVPRLDKAIDAYEQAAFVDPKNWKRHRDLGLLYAQVQLYSKAVASFNTSIQLDSSNASVYYNRGCALKNLGYYERAEKNLKKAKEMGFVSKDLNQQLSFVYEIQGRFQEAASMWMSSLSSDSGVSDWGRLVYLSSMGGNREWAQTGLNQMRLSKASQENIHFYQELIQYVLDRPTQTKPADVSDPTLKQLIESVVNKPITR